MVIQSHLKLELCGQGLCCVASEVEEMHEVRDREESQAQPGQAMGA